MHTKTTTTRAHAATSAAARRPTRGRLFSAASSAALAMTLAACGGGGSDSDPATPGGTVDTPIASDLQASTIVARSIGALFAYDNLNSEVIVKALGQLPARANGGAGITSSGYPAACDSGTAMTTYNDADGDTILSIGDSAVLAASNCATGNGFPWVLDGSVTLQLVSGVNLEPHLYVVAQGSAGLRVTHTGSSIGGARTVTGTYELVASNALAGAPPDQAISIGSLAVAHASANLQMTGVAYSIVGSNSLTTATGTFDTTVAGIGNVTTTLSVKRALGIVANTTRFRPSSGTVTLTGANFSVDVTYGAAGAVTIQVDNGKDGVVDRTVVTTEDALDALLTAP